MQNTTTFPCPACGAPVEPEAGLDRMACPYCHTQLTIPPELRRKAPPVIETPRVEPPQLSPQETQQQVADFIRQVQPVAIKGWNMFALWTWIRRLAPGCLIALMLTCGLFCLLLVAFIGFIQR